MALFLIVVYSFRTPDLKSVICLDLTGENSLANFSFLGHKDESK